MPKYRRVNRDAPKRKKKGRALYSLLNFIEKYYHVRNPYFTDLMKCGLPNQTNKEKKELFPLRSKNCIKQFLLKEIDIIKPKTIICVGRVSYNALVALKNEKIIKKTITLVHLIHYTQAPLHLKSVEKEKIIWPYQIGELSANHLLKLDCIKKLLNE